MNIVPVLSFHYNTYRRYYCFICLPFFIISGILLYLKKIPFLSSAAVCFAIFGSFSLGLYEYHKLYRYYHLIRPSDNTFYLSSIIFSTINATIMTIGMLSLVLIDGISPTNALLIPVVFLASIFSFSFASLFALIFKKIKIPELFIGIIVFVILVYLSDGKWTKILNAINRSLEISKTLLISLPLLFGGSVICFLLIFLKFKIIKK